MASIIKRPNKHIWVQFKGCDGRRKTIRLGPVPKNTALEVKLRVERIIISQSSGGVLDAATAAWLGEIGHPLKSKLAAAGLIVQTTKATLQRLIDDFRKSLDVKPSTACNIACACDGLLSFFGVDKPLEQITEADAKTFRSWLALKGGEKGGPLALTTVSRRCRRGRQVFQYAVERRWISANPFSVLRGSNEVNRGRDFFVTLVLINDVLAQIPSVAMRAVVVLARFGGLRCPSEVLPLTWDQVNWAKETILIRSPKTARHDDGACRTLPMFPEVREALEALWDEAPEGESLLFPRLQVTGTALTNELRRACWSAGYALWPKPWQNMRATRETELLEQFPLHVVANWLGHSPNVALKHYAQIVKEHNAKAVKMHKSVLRPESTRSKIRSIEKLNSDKEFTSIYSKKSKNDAKS